MHHISVKQFLNLLTVMQQIGNDPGLPLRTWPQCLLSFLYLASFLEMHSFSACYDLLDMSS